MRRRFGRTWRRAALVLAAVLLATAPALAGEPLPAGTAELTIAGGYSVSGDFGPDRDVRTEGIYLLPHLGYVFTDERGPSWLRGNAEVLAEPTLLRFDTGDSTAAGLSILGRWLFAGWGGVRPYLEAGAGALGGSIDLPGTSCETNFVLQAGPGLLVFVSRTTALTVGYRYHHLSNAGQCEKNLGLNSSLFTVGLSYFFR